MVQNRETAKGRPSSCPSSSTLCPLFMSHADIGAFHDVRLTSNTLVAVYCYASCRTWTSGIWYLQSCSRSFSVCVFGYHFSEQWQPERTQNDLDTEVGVVRMCTVPARHHRDAECCLVKLLHDNSEMHKSGKKGGLFSQVVTNKTAANSFTCVFSASSQHACWFTVLFLLKSPCYSLKSEKKKKIFVIISQQWCCFSPKALKKDKAYLAVVCLPALSTIRRQQEASQALAFNASGGGLSSGDGNTARLWLLVSQIWARINKTQGDRSNFPPAWTPEARIILTPALIIH